MGSVLSRLTSTAAIAGLAVAVAAAVALAFGLVQRLTALPPG